MRIGELAKKSNCLVETIRYYEKSGLMHAPGRTGGNYRLYGEAHLERLRFIRHCRLLDMALDEIRQLLQFCEAPDENCGEINALLDEHIGHVTERIRELKMLERQLRQLRAACASPRTVKDCGIVLGLAGAVAGVHGRGGGRYIGGAHAARKGNAK